MLASNRFLRAVPVDRGGIHPGLDPLWSISDDKGAHTISWQSHWAKPRGLASHAAAVLRLQRSQVMM